jgi:hypothetical protein
LGRGWFIKGFAGTIHTRRCELYRMHTRSGQLFQGRFKSLSEQNDAYPLQPSCYIHRNPSAQCG